MNRSILLVFFLFHFGALAQIETTQIDRYKELLETMEPGKGVAALYNDLAWEYYHADYDSAMHYAQKALDYSITIEDKYWHSVSLEMLALLSESRGDIEGAIKLYLEVIPLREEIGGAGLENTYNNMAVAFKAIGNYETALSYFRKSLDIETANGNSEGIAGSLINIAITEKELGKTDSLSYWLQKAVAISQEIEDKRTETQALLNLGDLYQDLGQIDSAKTYYSKSLIISKETDDLRSGTVAALGLAQILAIDEDYEEALSYLKEAESVAIEINALEYLKRIYLIRSQVLESTRDYKGALASQTRFIHIQDSIMNLEVISLTAELEGKYQNEKSERQIAEMQLTATKSALAAETNEKQRRLLVFAAVLLIILLAFLTYRYFKKAETSRLLTEKNKTIELALNDREILLKEIHHRVKNNLQVVSSLLSIQGREISDQKALEAVNESRNRVHSMALIHQYLYSENDLKSIDMQQYITQLCKRLFSAYKLDHDLVDLRIEVDPIHVDVDTAVPMGIVINELITNALKYAFPDNREGFLEVKLYEKGGKLNLNVRDNGVGKSAEAREGFSFGSKLIEAFKKKLNAELEINHQNGYEVHYKIGKYRLWEGSIAS